MRSYLNYFYEVAALHSSTSVQLWINYQDGNFLQIKGSPIGTHFVPPFATIMMHKLETQALVSHFVRSIRFQSYDL